MKKTRTTRVNQLEDSTQSIGKTNSNKQKETVKTMDLEDKIELQRREAYIKPKTRDLLRKLLQAGDKEEIIPVYTSGVGFVYPIKLQ